MTDPKLDIKARLNKVFRKIFDNDSIEIFEHMTTKDVPGWDSLTHITLIIAVEKEFNVKFNAKDIGNLANVGGMIDLISTRTK
jgi:acyl carrier protein